MTSKRVSMLNLTLKVFTITAADNILAHLKEVRAICLPRESASALDPVLKFLR